MSQATRSIFTFLLFMAAACAGAAEHRIQMIYFGGNDCPPCVAWRGTELPKLQKSEVFSHVEFYHVAKAIKSPVPAALFFPNAIQGLREKLDIASGHRQGSPQTAIVVDGEVYDYFWGAKPAEEIEQRLTAIFRSEKYPFKRCTEYSTETSGGCIKRN